MTRALIFDMDGTVANTDHRKHFLDGQPKDWDGWHARAHLDTPHRHIVELAQLVSMRFAVIVCSGRGEEQRLLTETWLHSHGVPFARLYMRPASDFRADDIVKRELLEQILADGFEPVMAFDDRSRVVAMWRREGIPCLQVAPGDF